MWEGWFTCRARTSASRFTQFAAHHMAPYFPRARAGPQRGHRNSMPMVMRAAARAPPSQRLSRARAHACARATGLAARPAQIGTAPPSSCALGPLAEQQRGAGHPEHRHEQRERGDRRRGVALEQRRPGPDTSATNSGAPTAAASTPASASPISAGPSNASAHRGDPVAAPSTPTRASPREDPRRPRHTGPPARRALPPFGATSWRRVELDMTLHHRDIQALIGTGPRAHNLTADDVRCRTALISDPVRVTAVIVETFRRI